MNLIILLHEYRQYYFNVNQITAVVFDDYSRNIFINTSDGKETIFNYQIDNTNKYEKDKNYIITCLHYH